jgi:hypothetical protein
MSGPPREPKSKQSGGDLKISLTPAGLFVVAMIVFFFAGGIFAYVQLLTRSLQINQSPSPNTQKSPASGYFSKEPAASATPLGLCWPASSNSSTHADANTGRNSSHTNPNYNSGNSDRHSAVNNAVTHS